MADQTIADLAAALGLDLNSESFNAGEAAIKAIIYQLNLMALEAKLASTEVNKALATIGLGGGGGKDKGPEGKLEKLVGLAKKVGLAVGAYMGVSRLKSMTEHVIEAGANLGDLADKTGVALDELQELGYAAEMNGVSIHAMGSTLNRLNINLAQAVSKGGELAKSFKKAGIDIKDAEGKARPAADVLGDVADHLASLDENDRPAKAFQLLGKQGKDLIPLLKNGSEGIRKFREEAQELGIVLDKDTVEAMDKVDKDTKRLGKAWEGLKNETVKALLPSIEHLVKDLLAWVKANKGDITKVLVGAFKSLGVVLKVVAEIFKGLITIAAFFARNWRPVLTIITSLGIAFGVMKLQAFLAGRSLLVLAAQGVKAGYAMMTAWIKALAPLLLMALAVLAVILVIEDLYTWWEGGESVIAKFYYAVKDYIADGLTALWDNTIGYLIGVFKKFVDWVLGKIEWLWDKIKAVGRAIKEFAGIGGPAGDILARQEEGEKMGLSGDALKQYAVNGAMPAPQIPLPGNEGGGGGTANNTNTVNNTFNITGDAETIKKVVTEEAAKAARFIQATVGGALK